MYSSVGEVLKLEETIGIRVISSLTIISWNLSDVNSLISRTNQGRGQRRY